MSPSTLQTLCQIAIVIGSVIAAFGGFGAYYYGKQVENQKATEEGKKSSQNIAVENAMNSPIIGTVQKQTINYYQMSSKTDESNNTSHEEAKNKSESKNQKSQTVIAPNALIYTNNQKGDNTVINNLDIPKPQISTTLIKGDVFIGEYQGVKNAYLTEILLKIDSKIAIPEFIFQMQGSNIINVRSLKFDTASGKETVPLIEIGGKGNNIFNNTIQNALGVYKVKVYTDGPQPQTIIAWDYDKFPRVP